MWHCLNFYAFYAPPFIIVNNMYGDNQNMACVTVIQVRYHVNQDALIYGCTSYVAAAAAIPGNVTMAAVPIGNCVDNYHGYYANGICEYCCLSSFCNRDKTSSWIKTDCNHLRSSAATITVATAAVAMATVTSWRLIMAEM